MPKTAVEPVFVDTNILVYVKQALSPFNAQATAKLKELAAVGHALWTSRQILREYLVAMSHPAALTGPVPMTALVADVLAFEKQFQMAEDGPAVTAELLNLLSTIPVAGKQVHDANIVATMLSHGIKKLVTHNVKDFNRYAGLITVIPLIP